MITVKFLLAMFVMAAVDGSFDHKHPQCSKEWIRYLVLNACNYSKRHTAMVQYIVEESIMDMQLKLSKTMSNHESRQSSHSASGSRRTNKKITSELVHVDNKLLLLQSPSEIKMEGDNQKDERGRTSSSGSLLEFYSQDLLSEIQQDEEVWKRRTRSIKTLVERCCVKLCKEEDFKVLCFV